MLVRAATALLREAEHSDPCKTRTDAFFHSASSTFLPLCSEGSTLHLVLLEITFFFFFFKLTEWRLKGIKSSLLGLCRSRKMAQASLGTETAFISHRIFSPKSIQKSPVAVAVVWLRGRCGAAGLLLCSGTRSRMVPSARGDPHASRGQFSGVRNAAPAKLYSSVTLRFPPLQLHKTPSPS